MDDTCVICGAYVPKGGWSALPVNGRTGACHMNRQTRRNISGNQAGRNRLNPIVQYIHGTT